MVAGCAGAAGIPLAPPALHSPNGQSLLWDPSHSGWCAERLQAQNHSFFDSAASNFTGVNSEPLCEPSQNGCLALLPQAHHQ